MTEHPDDFALRVEHVHHAFARMAHCCPHHTTVCRAKNDMTEIALCGIDACPVLRGSPISDHQPGAGGTRE